MLKKINELLKNKLIILIILFLVSIIIKLIFKVDYLEDYDAIDFAFGLSDYDLAAYKPHFPGYPVYIFLGRILFYFVKDATQSLVLLNIIFGSFCVVTIYMLVYEIFGENVALLASFFFMANPAISILSNSVNSDVCGLFFLILFLYYVVKSEKYVQSRLKSIFIASLFLGLTFGVRLSYLPFVFAWFFYSKFFSMFKLKDYENLHLDDNTFISAAIGLIVGIAIWLVPLLLIVGVKNYYYEGLKFVSGHFNDWGGVYSADSSILIRVKVFLWQLFPKGLGTYFYDTSLLRLVPTIVFSYAALNIIWNKKEKNEKTFLKFFLVTTIPYTLWIFYAQNIEKVRHVVPLIPIILAYLSFAVLRIFNYGTIINKKFGVILITLTVVLVQTDTFSLLSIHKDEPSPAYSIMKYLSEKDETGDSIIYCGETERFFSYYNSNYQVKRFKTAAEAIDHLNGLLIEPENIYLTSTLEGVQAQDVKEVVTFSRSKYVYNPYNEITLYKLNRKSINLLEFL